jgi:hypothetical protein
VYATCLAVNAEGFTAIAEGMMPDAAASFLNAYFEALAQPLSGTRQISRSFTPLGGLVVLSCITNEDVAHNLSRLLVLVADS